MKKVLLLMAMLIAGIAIQAQENLLTNGIYEKKVVVTVDSVKASTLYVRALEALSDWAGSQQRSKVNVDVQDKDEGLVVYKGQLYNAKGSLCKLRARVSLQYLSIFAEDFRRHAHNISSVEERQPQVVVSATTGNALCQAVCINNKSCHHLLIYSACRSLWRSSSSFS